MHCYIFIYVLKLAIGVFVDVIHQSYASLMQHPLSTFLLANPPRLCLSRTCHCLYETMIYLTHKCQAAAAGDKTLKPFVGNLGLRLSRQRCLYTRQERACDLAPEALQGREWDKNLQPFSLISSDWAELGFFYESWRRVRLFPWHLCNPLLIVTEN